MKNYYLLLPFITWLTTGFIKFLFNCHQNKRFAFDLIGYGGFPSNHSAIVSSTTFYIFLNEGLASASFGVSLTVAFIVILDAASLRKQVGLNSMILNRLVSYHHSVILRERIGHSKVEILGGVLTGIIVATILYSIT